MLGLADALGALRPAAIEMTAATEAALDLFVEQTIGPLLGTALMTAFDVGCEGGIPAEALVMEMYMSSEMEAVFDGFLRGRLPITDAEARLRRAANLPDPPDDRG